MKKFIINLQSHIIYHLRIFYTFFVISLVVLSIARIGLVFSELPRVDQNNSLGFVLLQGLRFDIITTSLFCLVAYLFWLCTSWYRHGWKASQWVLRIYFSGCILLMIFMEISSPSFIEQFDIRPNYLFVEYLNSPKEIFHTLFKAYLLQLVLAAIILPIAFVLTQKMFKTVQAKRAPSLVAQLFVAPIVILILVLGARSTLSHRPINPSVVAKTSDLLVNSLALNSTYSLFYAIYSAKKHEQGDINYGRLNSEEVLTIIKKAINVDEELFTSKEIPTLHASSVIQPSKTTTRPKNLVIILQESLGAEFVGSLGGLPLTPNIDAFKNQGIWFENMYATGTRSARGIEAVITGFLPTPARSVLKLPKSQSNFFTVASLLKEFDYETSFIYGGEAHFDNMRNFFVGNGFSKIIEEKDYENPRFVGSWGVSDEDLFSKADQHFSSLGNKPFFSLVFSSSNHTPFEYPENTIEPYDSEHHTVNNAVKYADYAFGKFVEIARKSSYWDDTIFVLVADHNSRVYGDDLIPIERFHIPAFIFGGSINAQQVDRIASQIDLIPTLLPLMGIRAEIPCIGLDLLNHSTQSLAGRALFQFHDIQGYLEDDRIVVMQNNIPPSQYRYRDGKLSVIEDQDGDLTARALAHAIWGPDAYQQGLYRLPHNNMAVKMLSEHRHLGSPKQL